LDDALEHPGNNACFAEPSVDDETREATLAAALGLETRLLLPALLGLGSRLLLVLPEGDWRVLAARRLHFSLRECHPLKPHASRHKELGGHPR
jgi:hypothetical protein